MSSSPEFIAAESLSLRSTRRSSLGLGFEGPALTSRPGIGKQESSCPEVGSIR